MTLTASLPRPIIPAYQALPMQLSRLVADCLQHLSVVEQAASNTLHAYDLNYRQFIAYLIGRGLMDDVRQFTTENVEGFTARLYELGVKGSTVRHKLVSLSTLGRFATKKRDARGKPLLAKNPCEGVDRPRRVRPATKFLLPDELAAFLAVPRPINESVARALVINTGCRASEVCHANVGDVIEVAGRAYLRTRVKGGRTHDVPVSPSVVEALKDSLLARNVPDPEEPLLVNSQGARYTRMALSELFVRIGRAAGIARFRVSAHVLRHTMNVVAKHAKIDPYTRSRLLTHSSMRTLQQYEHLLPDELHEARAQQQEGLASYLGKASVPLPQPDDAAPNHDAAKSAEEQGHGPDRS